MFEEQPVDRDVVLVVGASGFLGQHVIKLLQEKDEEVDEIRCFDLKSYENKLGHLMQKPMKITVGDILKPEQLLPVVQGVRWIINCAQVVDCEDKKKYHQVNTEGVRLLLDAAHHHSVPYFIQVSSADIGCGDNANYYTAENTLVVPKKPLRVLYGRSKYAAELIVGKANGRFLGDGLTQLRTIILRPTLLYGEGDKRFVPTAMRVASDFRGSLLRVSNVFTRIQPCYVGNAAWAVIKAKQRLPLDKSLGSEEFFITDDSAILDPFDFFEPFLASRQLRVTYYAIPFWILAVFLYIFYAILSIFSLAKPVKIASRYRVTNIHYYCVTHFFNRNKATLRLDYEPFYEPETAMKNAKKYYEKCPF